MDRFIVAYLLDFCFGGDGLKSNMDRFIADFHITAGVELLV